MRQIMEKNHKICVFWISLAGDAAPSWLQKRTAVVQNIMKSPKNASLHLQPVFFSWILSQQVVCVAVLSLKVDEFMSEVLWTVIFIPAKDLNSRQFDSLHTEESIMRGLPYHTEASLIHRRITGGRMAARTCFFARHILYQLNTFKKLL